MRIEDLYPPAVRSAEASGASEKSAEADRPPREAQADSVSLSRLSQALFLSGPHQARLEQLRLLLESGAYQVAAPDISHSIVEFYLEPAAEESG